MLNIRVIGVGKFKEEYWSAAAAEYIKRLSPYCRLEVEETPESRLPARPSQAELAEALSREADGIELRIPKGATVIAMCIEGKMLDSPKFSEFLSLCAAKGVSKLCFVIGGSHGLDERIKKLAALKLSMSKMTFPHHMARVMLLEQLYRGFKIAEGSKYHK
ncbi:MAG: 23S rRNA (pseudouridine(1915)-N(3))-methyltransferase RlmH [Clostridiales bacterium]|nr:23S rRNA (pseudouridine(1915)-N(3))-methyltransferase RlmH [Clostridiales bacterium]